MPDLSVFQFVSLGFYAWFVGFPTRKTCLFSMQPNGLLIRKRMFFKM